MQKKRILHYFEGEKFKLVNQYCDHGLTEGPYLVVTFLERRNGCEGKHNFSDSVNVWL